MEGNLKKRYGKSKKKEDEGFFSKIKEAMKGGELGEEISKKADKIKKKGGFFGYKKDK